MPLVYTKEEIKNYRALAKDRLRDAMESTIFICGMAPLDIFQCDPSLECKTHIEANYYTVRIRSERIELCCHCAGEFNSPVELNTNLKHPKGPNHVVLPVCKACLENGCNIVVRAARQNAQANQAMIDAIAAREAGR